MLMNAAALICFVIVCGVMIAVKIASGKSGQSEGRERYNKNMDQKK